MILDHVMAIFVSKVQENWGEFRIFLATAGCSRVVTYVMTPCYKKMKSVKLKSLAWGGTLMYLCPEKAKS